MADRPADPPTRVPTAARTGPATGPAAGPQSLRTLQDDLGLTVRLGTVRRVVSLVPSLTEAVAVTAPGLLVGATDWCTHPADLQVTRIGGTKNPDVPAIVALAPDLVLANEEENRLPDLDALRAAGLPVWVTGIRTLDQALASLDRMLGLACGLARPAWLDQAQTAWQDVRPPGPPLRAVVPVWRRPWMVLGRDTFAGDVLRRLGAPPLHADHAERYPAVPVGELNAARPDLVVLPDEPYRFTAEDGPEAFPGVPAALVSGRHLTWYGPSLAEAPDLLAAQLATRLPPVAGARGQDGDGGGGGFGGVDGDEGASGFGGVEGDGDGSGFGGVEGDGDGDEDRGGQGAPA